MEEECYTCNEFLNFREAYEIISQYIEYYNNRRIHGSLGYYILLLIIMKFTEIKIFWYRLLNRVFYKYFENLFL
ncbi:IS3 family transposase [Thermosyntropha sp.]|uniref:IS3 family transposase n=1 Tax=Thermosyntropha sp. TaxID=2740820 RepID=UPI00344CB96E|nr:IS3 family transposase [Thermosyntropha sp.]